MPIDLPRSSRDYRNPWYDSSFKLIFTSKECLVTLLNSLLPMKIDEIHSVSRTVTRSAPPTPSTSAPVSPKIRKRPLSVPGLTSSFDDLTIANTEEVGKFPGDRVVGYDIRAVTMNNVTVDVEMQWAPHQFFLHRIEYYSSRLVGAQGYAGKKAPRDIVVKARMQDPDTEPPIKLSSIKGTPPQLHDRYVCWAQPTFDPENCIPKLDRNTPVMPLHCVVYYCLISLPAYRTQYVARKTTLETPSTSSILDMILSVLAYTGDDRIRADISDVILKHKKIQPLLEKLRGSAMSENDRFEYEADKRNEKDDASKLETEEARGLELGRELEAKSDVLKCAGVTEDVLRGWYKEEGISTPGK
ncbi:hypothetical protein BDK51DRAFT_32187 [Blyttiomyces helicus]|uniref:Uncharacterized protein n=1 Tax=Blyttiomyces helicus TaxID=388810 RepID=A0A4P9VXX8_9FUNG|nr:hypothetical protein BDK51DRAFT_32187 [Blyttiomyces helicus]|eukprot:RKO83148.1 hypothetical protein BDK51DRAFT_32187 [Blyttiomyces helicus]